MLSHNNSLHQGSHPLNDEKIEIDKLFFESFLTYKIRIYRILGPSVWNFVKILKYKSERERVNSPTPPRLFLQKTNIEHTIKLVIQLSII